MPGYIERAASQIADILMREGLDYTQTKAVFKQARAKAGLILSGWPFGPYASAAQFRNCPRLFGAPRPSARRAC